MKLHIDVHRADPPMRFQNRGSAVVACVKTGWNKAVNISYKYSTEETTTTNTSHILIRASIIAYQ